MILHIFRKDLLLLWPIALLVGVLHVLAAAVTSAQGLFGEPRFLRVICDLLAFLSLLCVSFVVLTALHQDPIPGVRQDWLVRPIRRRDLFFAKLLFVLLAAVGPLLVVDTGVALLRGFAFLPALDAAFSHSVTAFLLFALPAMVIGAVTRNAVEALLMIIAGVIVCVAIGLLKLLLDDLSPGLLGTGLEWMIYAALSLLAVVMAAVVLPLQFSRRKTMAARLVIAGAVLAVPLTIWMPWPAVFAVQQSLDDSAVTNAITLAFAPAAERIDNPAGVQPGDSPVRTLQLQALKNVAAQVFLPLEVTGLGADGRLFADKINVRIVGANNVELYRGEANVFVNGGLSYFKPGTLQVPAPQPGAQASKVHQQILLPRSLYPSLKNQTVRLELDYSMTLLHSGPSSKVAAVGADQKIANLGWCQTRIGGEGYSVQLGCMNTGEMPRCGAIFLQQPMGELSNRAINICNPSYEKLRLDLLYPFRRFVFELPFRDLSGQAHFAVDESRLDGAQIVFDTYVPQAHFTRSLVIPSIRLGDWEVQASVAGK